MKIGDFVRETNGSWLVYRVTWVGPEYFKGVLCNSDCKYHCNGEPVFGVRSRYAVEPDPEAFARRVGERLNLTTEEIP